MNITIKKTLDVTAPLEEYIEQKLAPTAKLVAPFERGGDVELRLEVARTTRRHKKGDEVFKASADLRLPGRVVRSEATAADIRTAIDEMRDTLHVEIKKYKTRRAPKTDVNRKK